MNRQIKNFLSIVIPVAVFIQAGAQRADSILLKNFRPRSIYKIQVTTIQKAKFPVIDMHSHDYTTTQ